MSQSPFTRIAYLQTIFQYITNNPNAFLALRTVHSSWDECIIYYSEEAWRKIYTKYRDKHNNTLLHISVEKHAWMMKLFLNFDIDLKNENSDTALHIACDYGHVECVRLLADAGANIESQSALTFKWTPLHHAVRCAKCGAIECIKLLLERGANINAKDSANNTPLQSACVSSEQFSEHVKLLLENGASINERNIFGRTALHSACIRPHENCVKLLLEHNADKEIKDIYGFSAANVNAVSRDGNTPLHGTCWSNTVETTKLLLEHGANKNVRNRNGFTPLQMVQRDGDQKHATLLENWKQEN